MKKLEQKVDLKNLDKSNWKSFRFDQIAKNISERVNPNNTDLEVYVGLEHLDSENIHITRTGTRDDVNGEKLRFYPGDIIFGRRRAYQRKAAIATCDGFCSAHSLVLRANPDTIHPKLFPFFLHSDLFMHRAVDISVGSLSPTINWGTLKAQEFLLPPKDQQAQLAELLWAMDEVIETRRNLLFFLMKGKQCLLQQVFKKDNCIKYKISEVSENLDNKRIPIKESIRQKGKYPYYGASGITDYVNDYIFEEPILLISEDGENLISRKLPIAYSVNEKCWVNNHAHVLRVTKVSRYLVQEYFNFHDISDYITGGTRPKITKSMLLDMPIYLPKPQISKLFEEKLIGMDKSINCGHNSIKLCRFLQKSLINQIF